MASSLELQSKLEELLGSRNVYYQPPENLKMNYPAIVYSKTRPDVKRANDQIYLQKNRYEIIVISKSLDNPVMDKLIGLPYCSYDRNYISDNLHHDVFTLYY